MGGLLSLFGDEEANGQQHNRNQRSQAKRPQVTAEDRAILQLRHQRDELNRYLKKGAAVIAREVELSLQFAKEGKKEKALLCLKKKRFQERLLQQAEKSLANVEELTDTLEFTVVQKDVFDGLKAGSRTLKQLQEQMSIEEVEDIMLDTQEALEHQREVGNMLSEALDPEEEEDILRELAELTEDTVRMIWDHLLYWLTYKELLLPDAPTHPVNTEEPQLEQESPEIRRAALA